MALFRFKSTVSDPRAQLNFDQLEGLLGRVGGILFDSVATQQSTSAQAYGNLATVGPSITFPTAGVWLVVWGATIEAASQNRGQASISATDADAVSAAMGNPSAQSQGGSVMRAKLATVTAGQVMTMTYRNAIAASVSYEKRFLLALPVLP